ncbi:uncharacterized protein DUF3667 [Chitinophaga dinghuensis]|uniref:Uncharacterized protein DUF3667 n=1 Tax=Chitinophaga dinghuensis TaxID=1539050 RepID=A0A327WBZ2_9BACT|nr:DUF3667 domain-containing protein [Chitinophaga dinghuensis]RAJ88113.1 uncharacterized protein DUF3667 [Chitinophaga dinghuensis]
MKTQPLRSDNHCLNCGFEVPERFCSHCGQENTVQHETFGHLVKHFVADIFHYDSQFLLTLKYLLFRPGFLTREYMAGRRVRYVNPIKLYVFVSFVFFLTAFGVFSKHIITINSGADDTPRKHKKKTEAAYVIDSVNQLVSNEIAANTDSPKIHTEKPVTAHTSPDVSQSSDSLTGYRYHAAPDTAKQLSAERGASTNEPETAYEKGLISITHDSLDTAEGDSIHHEIAAEGDHAAMEALEGDGHGPNKEALFKFSPRVKRYLAEQAALPEAQRSNKLIASFKIRWYYFRDLTSGGLPNEVNSLVWKKVNEDLIHHAPKVMFLLLPLFALLTKWVYRKDKTLLYADHAIFALHFHSFMFITMLVTALIVRIWPAFDGFSWALWGSFIYLVLGLYNNYKRSIRRTIWKAAVIWINYILIVAFVLFLAGTVIFSVFL